ncbi:ribonuclease H-like domain-containing protein [Lactarius quietus]|nr:ribonuclease H-like domain-containing protein [Lactarius quietus]
MQLFIEKWIPGAIIPDRRTLSGPILDCEAGKVEDRLKLRLKGRKATFQTDGWKNKAKQAIVATMVSVDFEPYLMQTHDVSAQPKTGEALLQLVIEDIKWSEETYGLTVIAACSDDGGDARKMRRLLLVRMPWLVIILCWAHQINLIVGDYLSLKLPFQDCVPKALQVIKWMNNHSRALGLFRQEQLFMSPKFLALILPVLTRWTAHYLSLRRLLTVEKTLRVVWLKHADIMIASSGTKSEDKAKAIAVQAIINDLYFWYHINRTCSHLEPLAIAANVTQESNTRLYHVLTTLANLYRIYSNLSLPEDLDVPVLLNPFLRGNFLARRHVALTPIGLCNMLKRLHSCVFRMDTDTDFHAAFMDYFNKRNEFSPESMALADWTDMAKKNGQEVNPVEIWEGIDTHEETGRNRLTILAIHILSIVANSAGCERAFSHMGLVHTGIRSKLGVEKVRKTTMVGMDIKRSHLEAGLVPSRSKRNFTSFTSESDAGAQELNRANLTSVADIDDQELEDGLVDFNQLSKHLVASAASANRDRDIGDDHNDPNDEFPPDIAMPAASGSLLITIPPLNSSSLSPQATQLKKTCIPLEILFEYPTDTDLPSEGMNSFWKGGVENLEKEMEAYDILSSNEEASDGTQCEIMATVDVL